MPSVVERVRACGLPPPAGISYALNTPDWSLVTRIERSSGEKEAPNMAVVFMNCSIVYWRTGRAGRALCAAADPAIMLASARSGSVRRRYEGGRRTGRSGGGRSNLAVFRPARRFPIMADLLSDPVRPCLSKRRRSHERCKSRQATASRWQDIVSAVAEGWCRRSRGRALGRFSLDHQHVRPDGCSEDHRRSGVGDDYHPHIPGRLLCARAHLSQAPAASRILADDRHQATVCYVCSRGKVLLQRRAAGRLRASLRLAPSNPSLFLESQ